MRFQTSSVSKLPSPTRATAPTNPLPIAHLLLKRKFNFFSAWTIASLSWNTLTHCPTLLNLDVKMGAIMDALGDWEYQELRPYVLDSIRDSRLLHLHIRTPKSWDPDELEKMIAWLFKNLRIFNGSGNQVNNTKVKKNKNRRAKSRLKPLFIDLTFETEEK